MAFVLINYLANMQATVDINAVVVFRLISLGNFHLCLALCYFHSYVYVFNANVQCESYTKCRKKTSNYRHTSTTFECLNDFIPFCLCYLYKDTHLFELIQSRNDFIHFFAECTNNSGIDFTFVQLL